jgi:predicted small lipoprotein YifL
MKITALTAFLLLIVLGLGACGKKGELEAPDKNKDTAIALTQTVRI